MIRFAAVLAAMTAFAGTATAAEPSGAHEPVALEVVNGARQATLRCQLILAHFVTHQALLLPAGQRDSIPLDRYRDDGALTFARAGRTMAVERLLCGLDDDWAGTAGDLDLGPLRDGRLSRLRLRCGDEAGFACGPAADRQ